MTFPDNDDLVAVQGQIRAKQDQWDSAADELLKDAFREKMSPQEIYDRVVARGQELAKTIDRDSNKLQIITAMMVKLQPML